MLLQTCKAPYPTFIIISESWGTPSVHPPPFNESCIPSSHVASCTVLNWATVTKNGEVGSTPVCTREALSVCTGGPQNESALRKWYDGRLCGGKRADFWLDVGKIIPTAWELGQSAFENNSFELFWCCLTVTAAGKATKASTVTNSNENSNSHQQHQNHWNTLFTANSSPIRDLLVSAQCNGRYAKRHFSTSLFNNELI